MHLVVDQDAANQSQQVWMPRQACQRIVLPHLGLCPSVLGHLDHDQVRLKQRTKHVAKLAVSNLHVLSDAAGLEQARRAVYRMTGNIGVRGEVRVRG